MTQRTAYKLEAGKKLLLAAMGIAAVTAPIAVGLAHPAPVRIRPQAQGADALVPEYQVISLKLNKTGKMIPTGMLYRPNGFTAMNLTLRGLICAADCMQPDRRASHEEFLLCGEHRGHQRPKGAQAHVTRFCRAYIRLGL